jgi:hypothetical protein
MNNTMVARLALWISLVVFFFITQPVQSFTPGRIRNTVHAQFFARKQADSEEEETFSVDNKDSRRKDDSSADDSKYLLNDLAPPSVNFSRQSILFDDNPSTQRNNGALNLWRGAKTYLPPVFTGAWPWRDDTVADENPIAGLYNMAFVRLPVIGVGLLYGKNLVEGHPLIMDIGEGPFEMSPALVVSVLALILA